MADYSRIKRITQEERQARAQLKKMGVSEYELQRLYDANYKARKRAEFAGAKYGESLNLNWKNVLQGARQARARGESVSGYIQARRASYKAKYTVKEIKQQNIESITGGTVSDDWGAELVYKELNSLSAGAVLDIKANALSDMEEAGEALPEISNEAYKRAHRRYIEENASTQAEWDNFLRQERAKEIEVDETLLEYVANYLGINLDGIRRAQSEAEQIAASMDGAEREKFLQRSKRKAFETFGGV